VNSLLARMPRVLEWLPQVEPDVLCLQETKVSEETFPHLELQGLGYETAAHGLGAWNGVAILSKVGLEDVARGFDAEPGFPDPEARAIAATCGGVRVHSIYVPNGRTPDSPHYEYKLAWLASLTGMVEARPGPTVVCGDMNIAPADEDVFDPEAYVGQTHVTRPEREALEGELEGTSAPLALLGDFNIAPTDDDVWDPALFVDSTHVTPAERDALGRLLELGFTDVQPRIVKGEPFTYWDYRAGNFHKGFGMRIDLVLLANELAPKMKDAYIDRDARKGKKPSDHAPIVVDLDL
jgi:exodeoxyribonuclease-3